MIMSDNTFVQVNVLVITENYMYNPEWDSHCGTHHIAQHVICKLMAMPQIRPISWKTTLSDESFD